MCSVITQSLKAYFSYLSHPVMNELSEIEENSQSELLASVYDRHIGAEYEEKGFLNLIKHFYFPLNECRITKTISIKCMADLTMLDNMMPGTVKVIASSQQYTHAVAASSLIGRIKAEKISSIIDKIFAKERIQL